MSLFKPATFEIYADPLTTQEIAQAEWRWDAVLVAAFVLQVLTLCSGYVLLRSLDWDPQAGFLMAVLLAACGVGGCQSLLASRARFARQLAPIEPNECLLLARMRDEYPVVAVYIRKILAQKREVLKGELEAVQRYVALRQTADEVTAMRSALYTTMPRS